MPLYNVWMHPGRAIPEWRLVGLGPPDYKPGLDFLGQERTMFYVYEAEDGSLIEREFKMGTQPDQVKEGRKVYRRKYLPLQHRWKDPRPHSEAIVEGARAIKNSGKYDIETTIT